VEGNIKLAKVIYGAFYYILSSLPVTTDTNSPVGQFYGLSPGGLAYGTYLNDYQGKCRYILYTIRISIILSGATS